MEANAQVLQGVFQTAQQTGLGRGDQAGPRQCAPAGSESEGIGQPAAVLQIAQPPRAFLDIGFQVVGAVLEAGMTLLLLQDLGRDEARHVQGFAEGPAKVPEQTGIARDQARLEEIGGHGHVPRRLFQAGVGRAHAVADLQAHVPEAADQILDAARLLAMGFLAQQDHQIHVGMGELLPPPEATHRHQRRRVGQARGLPQRVQRAVEQIAVGTQILPGTG